MLIVMRIKQPPNYLVHKEKKTWRLLNFMGNFLFYLFLSISSKENLVNMPFFFLKKGEPSDYLILWKEINIGSKKKSSDYLIIISLGNK
jgi:hypothetical protein